VALSRILCLLKEVVLFAWRLSGQRCSRDTVLREESCSRAVPFTPHRPFSTQPSEAVTSTVPRRLILGGKRARLQKIRAGYGKAKGDRVAAWSGLAQVLGEAQRGKTERTLRWEEGWAKRGIGLSSILVRGNEIERNSGPERGHGSTLPRRDYLKTRESGGGRESCEEKPREGEPKSGEKWT